MVYMASINICQGRFNHNPMKFMLALQVSNHESHDPILLILPFLISNIFNANTMVPHLSYLSHYPNYPHQAWKMPRIPRAMKNEN
jgi:hypothetical protein